MDNQKTNNTDVVSALDVIRLTSQIVASYVSSHELGQGDLPMLVKEVYATLQKVSQKRELRERPKPAVPILQSITPEYIICLEDGLKLKMLKRHLMTRYGLTPVEYRKRWGLTPDYPMVASNYAQKRSCIAKEFGLGVGKTNVG